MTSSIDRREFLATLAAAQGAFVLGFWLPSRAEAQTAATTAWYEAYRCGSTRRARCIPNSTSCSRVPCSAVISAPRA